MKFLILSQYFAPEIGAGPLRLAAMARALKAQGHEVAVVTAMPNHPHGRILPEYRGALTKDSVWEGIPVHRVWVYAATGAGLKRMLNYASFAVMAGLGLVKAVRPDFVFVESPPLTASIPAIVAARLWRARVIVNVSDLWPDSIVALNLAPGRAVLAALRALERWMYRKADFVSAITAGVRQRLEAKGIEAERLLYLPNGVDPATFHPMPPDLGLRAELGLPENVVLYAGTIGYAHALETMIEAAEALRGRPDIHFMLVGDGSERARLEVLASTRGLKNITFHPAVAPEALPRYASIAKVAIVPQRDVPLFTGNRPAKLFAMMACAKPIVFCGNGEAAALVREAGSGITLPPEDPQRLAVALLGLLDDATALEQYGRNGRRYVEERYTWSVLVGSWLAELESRSLCAAEPGLVRGEAT